MHVINCFLNLGDFLSFFVRNFGFKFFFQSHYQLDGVKRVSPQIFDERSVISDLFQFYAKLLGHDFLDALFDIATHLTLISCA